MNKIQKFLKLQKYIAEAHTKELNALATIEARAWVEENYKGVPRFSDKRAQAFTAFRSAYIRSYAHAFAEKRMSEEG